MIKTWLLRLSVILNILVVLTVFAVVRDPGIVTSGFLETMRAQMVDQFEAFPVSSGDTVFLGDSITQAGPWEEMFPQTRTRNRGIAGDTTTDVLDRLDQVIAGTPKVIFFKLGTNDLTHGPEDRQVSYRQYREILERIRKGSPDTDIYVQSIMPRGLEFRGEVEAFNQEIQSITAEMDIPYIDLYPSFLAEDGSIIDEVSPDELHLNARGYTKWQALLQPYVESQ